MNNAAIDMEQKTCLIYTRVSTSKQVQMGVSLEAQLEMLQSEATKRGYQNVLLFSDEGLSAGSLKKRTGAKAFIAASKSPDVDLAIIYSQARLWRNYEDGAHILRTFKKNGVKLWSLSEGVDLTDQRNKLATGIRSVVDEEERDRASLRTKAAITFMKEQGRVYGKVPYGFMAGRGIAVNGKVKNRPLRINEAEVELVRKVFTMASVTKPYTIAKELNTQSVPTRSGGQWVQAHILSILRNKDLYVSNGIL